MSIAPMARQHRSVEGGGKDAFEEIKKRQEPLRCGGCGASLVNGRWTWAWAPRDTPEGQCPACHRIAVHQPAGDIVMSGAFVQERRDEILGLVKNVERKEKTEHPLERIMTVEETKENVRVSTTGVHMARRIGEALARSYDGKLELAYGEGDRSVRVRWER